MKKYLRSGNFERLPAHWILILLVWDLGLGFWPILPVAWRTEGIFYGCALRATALSKREASMKFGDAGKEKVPKSYFLGTGCSSDLYPQAFLSLWKRKVGERELERGGEERREEGEEEARGEDARSHWYCLGILQYRPRGHFECRNLFPCAEFHFC